MTVFLQPGSGPGLFGSGFESVAGDRIVIHDDDGILLGIGFDDGVDIAVLLERTFFGGRVSDVAYAQVGTVFEFDGDAFDYRNEIAGVGGPYTVFICNSIRWHSL